MRKIRKLEEILPIYKVENDCIISKQGDITIAFKVELPEIFTLAISDFETLHQAWIKAIRVLPNHTVLHKQDWFTEATYKADFLDMEHSFLSQASERYFNERPYLTYECFLFLTKRPAGRKLTNSLFSNLIRPTMVPQASLDTKQFELFMDKVGQFRKILEDSGYIHLHRMSVAELVSTNDKPGLIEKYCYLLQPEEPQVMRDVSIGEEIKIGDLHCSLFTLADIENLPTFCGSRSSYDKYSTDKTKFSVSFAAPLGQPIEVTAPVPDYPPMLFRYKGQLYKIAKADGPERIEQEWWISEGQHRDYYSVEDEAGQRFWIFRAGHYDAAKNYSWYLHGFFA